MIQENELVEKFKQKYPEIIKTLDSSHYLSGKWDLSKDYERIVLRHLQWAKKQYKDKKDKKYLIFYLWLLAKYDRRIRALWSKYVNEYIKTIKEEDKEKCKQAIKEAIEQYKKDHENVQVQTPVQTQPQKDEILLKTEADATGRMPEIRKIKESEALRHILQFNPKEQGYASYVDNPVQQQSVQQESKTENRVLWFIAGVVAVSIVLLLYQQFKSK